MSADEFNPSDEVEKLGPRRAFAAQMNKVGDDGQPAEWLELFIELIRWKQEIDSMPSLVKQVDVYEMNGLRLAKALEDAHRESEKPIPMYLTCPKCNARHIDTVFATKPHHTHSCQTCGLTWRPTIRNTVGVLFLPGFKDEETSNGG